MKSSNAEQKRLDLEAKGDRSWKTWGPYLSERQWGTVREDYSGDGAAWDYFPHDHARSRAYRWGEDGLLGICDDDGRLCFAFALWNGRDPILKERLFGLTNGQGNHGEDVKEEYWYLDSTPTHSWMRAAYRYPLAEFPYARLVEENRRRGADRPEFELVDTGVLDDARFVDAVVEYAKAGADDVLVRLTLENHAAEDATIDVLGTLWFRNTWAWGRDTDGHGPRPSIRREGDGFATSPNLGLPAYRLHADVDPDGRRPQLLLTGNETNFARLFGAKNADPLVKDAFHDFVIRGGAPEVLMAPQGTKAAARWRVKVPARGAAAVRLRLRVVEKARGPAFGAEFDREMSNRAGEADAFYAEKIPASLSADAASVARQAYAGLLWSKQFFHYDVRQWLAGDPSQPPPPPQRRNGRNSDWGHFHAADVISMPDKWEYPWYAAWDLAFHVVPFARIDPGFAKAQMLLLLREWYTHPNGQMPAYEWAFGDVNPPVHAWACWRVYEASGPEGARDRTFLARAFQKLLINFTWWVNRKDESGHHLFSGGFLGLDNIGVFDRAQPLPDGKSLQQADGTAWMAFYAATMLVISMELAKADPSYEDMATKFFEHFVAIADAMNDFGGTGLWDERDGFYYDVLEDEGDAVPLRVRSMVGIVPLFAAATLVERHFEGLDAFKRRCRWFLDNRKDLAHRISLMKRSGASEGRVLFAIPSRERLERVLSRVLDENEFLSPFGVRSMSRAHRDRPVVCKFGDQVLRVAYEPGEGRTSTFGGNSNWRGPIWLPMNYLLIEVLKRFHLFYGDDLLVEMPTGSGRKMNLLAVSREITRRLSSLFLRGPDGARPCLATAPGGRRAPDAGGRILFHEYFDGDTGRGLGASHQTGWTALIVRLLEFTAAGEEKS
jgi:hypothetical protein